MENPNSNHKSTLKFKDCGANELSKFISALEKSAEFERKSYQPISNTVHFERFNYVEGKEKISIVYDTKAKMLTITARDESLEKLKNIYDGEEVFSDMGFKIKLTPTKASTAKLQAPPQQKKQPKPQPLQSQPQPTQTQLKPQQPKPQPAQPQQQPKPQQALAPQQPKPQQTLAQPSQNQIKQPIAPKEEGINLEYKNGFGLKNYSQEAFDAALEQVKAIKGVSVKAEPEAINNGTKIQVFKIENKQNQKLFLRYLASKKNVQMQGKQSPLYQDVQMILFKGTDFKTVINTYIKHTGEDKKASTLERQLKKLIPNAYDYLSDQAKQYLTISFMDINNEETKLSDYSALMVSPYRGLERLIYDLQMSQKIEVKMIGQAYEKISEGKYCLKQGYKKRIQSVIYNEVMSDLYQEYFEKRNFYLHSDNSINSQMRVITNKEEAKKIFLNLIEIINYNYKKLQEIKFDFSKQQNQTTQRQN